MKIAHITSGFPVLSETFVRDEIDAFTRVGASNCVVSIRPPSEDFPPNDQIESVIYPKPAAAGTLGLFSRPLSIGEVSRFPDESIRNLYLKLIAPNAIARLKEWGAEHCHAHFAHYPATLAWICAKSLGIGFSFNAHSYDLHRYRSFFTEKIREAAHVFPISDQNRSRLLELGGLTEEESGKVETIRCGIDLSDYPFVEPISDPAQPPLLLAVGRLVDTKGFDILVDSIRPVLPDFPDLKVEIVGDGPDRERLQSKVEKLKLEDRVFLLGSLDREATRKKQQKATLVVQPCREGRNGLDGIPVVLMEAMALGSPVISTRFAAIPELIENGHSGILVPPGDARALSDAIRQSLANPDLARDHARNARKVIEAKYDGPKNFEYKAGILVTKRRGGAS
ncbi:MAG: glycosyltransferase [Candidatus Omnitrophica bacterium]|nr:glycosyltransferase [Candidatus Omnitrophota bacterium]